MPTPRLSDLTPTQVVQVQDALLQNADNLLRSAIAVLDLGNAGLARSLAILALEESGKAIAIHQRRVEMAYEPEGTPFVDQPLRREHIEAKQQAECAEPTPPASPENIKEIRKLLMNAMGDDGFDETTLDVLRHGRPGMTLNNDAYRLRLPSPGSNPFQNMGKPGYEAQTRELLRLGEENELPDEDSTPGDQYIRTER
ncbi:AbiV family abortive infection protein [Nocardia asiatica]|uniref:AbiV family abortive infection protein n=1 Tax=Nocardia asiatica TaxID=209252 RepID=UPI0009FDF063|nr:AbiV family abortive infection protein [Nocardia asiatica]